MVILGAARHENVAVNAYGCSLGLHFRFVGTDLVGRFHSAWNPIMQKQGTLGSLAVRYSVGYFVFSHTVLSAPEHRLDNLVCGILPVFFCFCLLECNLFIPSRADSHGQEGNESAIKAAVWLL